MGALRRPRRARQPWRRGDRPRPGLGELRADDRTERRPGGPRGAAGDGRLPDHRGAPAGRAQRALEGPARQQPEQPDRPGPQPRGDRRDRADRHRGRPVRDQRRDLRAPRVRRRGPSQPGRGARHGRADGGHQRLQQGLRDDRLATGLAGGSRARRHVGDEPPQPGGDVGLVVRHGRRGGGPDRSAGLRGRDGGGLRRPAPVHGRGAERDRGDRVRGARWRVLPLPALPEFRTRQRRPRRATARAG